MLRTVFVSTSFALCFAAQAAAPVTVDTLIQQSLGDATPRSLVGRSVTVAAVRFGELGFTVARHNAISFVCGSGDKSLTGKKPKAATFEGVTTKAQGWEGSTIWYLKDCRLSAPVGAAVPVAAAVPVVAPVVGDRKTTVPVRATNNGAAK